MPSSYCHDQFVQFEANRSRVSVLRVLNEEHNQKGKNAGPHIHDQLPCVRKVQEWPADRPENNQATSDEKCQC